MKENGWEVEVKHCHGDFGPLRKTLKAMGALPQTPWEEEDTYYRHPQRDFAQTGEVLRVRRVKGETLLCYKGPRQDGPAKVKREIEVHVEGKEIGILLLALGFSQGMTISKTRELWTVMYTHQECRVCLDDAHGLGHFVELEVVVPKEDISWAQRKVIALATELGLGDREERSYLRMHIEKGQ